MHVSVAISPSHTWAQLLISLLNSPSGGKVGAKAVAPEEEADMEMSPDMDPKHTAEGQDEDPVHASMSAAMAEGYKTDMAAPPAYTSETPAAATTEEAAPPASYMTEDTMMAMPTEEAKPTESSMMEAAATTMMSSSAEPAPYVPVAKTSSSVMYGSNNATKTAGSPAASGTGMGAPKPYEGGASGLMVPSMVLGAGLAVLFGMAL